MMTNKIPMTRDGYEKLKRDLEFLKKEEQPKIIKEMSEARAFGDLSENAEYEAAKERHAFIMGRISQIENRLSRAEIINITNLNYDRVVFGATVFLKDINTGEERKYKIVGEDEIDVENGKISVNSPLARGLIGHSIKEIVNIKTPGGIKELEIIDISFDR